MTLRSVAELRPRLPWVVMGVLNVTPDSFSDGGRYADLAAAVAHGIRLTADGADLIDVGGESTRPGADRVEPAEEIRRIVPVIRELAAARVVISVDTTRAAVAAAALEAGAQVVNDVSGGLADPEMPALIAEAGCPWVLMHWRGHSRDMYALASYDDPVADVRRELDERVCTALAAGVRPEQLVLDPGIGFAKRPAHDWALLHHLDTIRSLGYPVLVGTSRKSFLGRLLADRDGQPRPIPEREDATLATSVLAAVQGAWGIRVHAVRPTVDALTVTAAWQAGKVPDG